MSKKKFILQVPDEPAAEFVSHGNHSADLVPGGKVETTDERFANWLVSNHGLEIVETVELEPEPAAEPTGEPVPTNEGGSLPEDLPGREALLQANVSFDTVKTLTAEQLVAYKGIGPKTAAEIVAYFEGGTE